MKLQYHFCIIKSLTTYTYSTIRPVYCFIPAIINSTRIYSTLTCKVIVKVWSTMPETQMKTFPLGIYISYILGQYNSVL